MAKRQAYYNGALGARGIYELRSFRADTPIAYDNNAYTITPTYYSATGTLQAYIIHPTQPIAPENPPEYYMNQLEGWVLTGSNG